MILVAVAACTFFVRAWLIRRFDTKCRVNYRYADGDIQWDAGATTVYPALCGLACLFAGMFGIRGGIVKGPLMLSMGVHPAVASATMILYTSFTATTSYMVFGLFPLPEYAAVCISFGFVSTFFGQILLSI